MLPSRNRGRPDGGPFALRKPRHPSQTEHRQAAAYGPVRITFALQPRSVVRALLWTIAILVTLSTVGRLIVGSLEPGTYKGLGELLKRFDLDWERNIPTLFSSLLILSCALLLFYIAASSRRASDRWARHWAFLALVFVYLVVDEAASLHEMLILPLRKRFDLAPAFHYPWVVPAFVCVVVFGLVYLPFIRALRGRTRWLFLSAAAVYVGGALGMEMVCGYMFVEYGEQSLAYLVAMTLEETMEMTGMVIFLYALLDFLRREQRVEPVESQERARAVSTASS